MADRRRFALLSLLLLLGSFGLALAPAYAQVITTIRYEQTVSGAISKDAFRQVYTFAGKQGDVLDITLKVTGGNLDAILILTDEQNTLLARDDDSAKGFSASISSFQLPHDGNYFIVAARFGQERGLTTGTFTLTLSRVGLNGSPAGAILRYGDNVVGDITPEQPEQVYSFTARRGDLIHISLQRISGDLDPALILADSQGNIITVNDEDPLHPGTLDAALNSFLILKTDNYLIVATRFGREAGTTRGGFSLTLERIPPESLGNAPDKPLFTDYGVPITGTIDNDSITRYYQFEGKKGDVVTVEVERTRGNLDPTLALLSPERNLIKANDAGQRGQLARITAFTIPRDGFYVIAVSRYNGDKGFTAGDFRLTVVGRQGVTVGPNGVLLLSYGGAVTSTIDAGSLDQQFVFEGKAGELVTITMQPTSDTLLPYVLLYDPARRIIGQDDPNQPIAAQLSRIKLPVTGAYIIIATRHARTGGTSSGSFLLTLTKEGT